MHVVGDAAIGDWAGQDKNLARYVAASASWQFYTAGDQVRFVFNVGDGGLYVWHASAWALLAPVEIEIGWGNSKVRGTDGSLRMRRRGVERWIAARDGPQYLAAHPAYFVLALAGVLLTVHGWRVQSFNTVVLGSFGLLLLDTALLQSGMRWL